MTSGMEIITTIMVMLAALIPGTGIGLILLAIDGNGKGTAR